MFLIGDKVYIIFLSSDEKDIIVINVVRNGDLSLLVLSNKFYFIENG